MNLRWVHIKQCGWDETGSMEERRLELQCLRSLISSFTLPHILCLVLFFFLYYLTSPFLTPSIPLSLHPMCLYFLHLPSFTTLSCTLLFVFSCHSYFFLIFHPSVSSIQCISPDIPEDEAQYWTSKLERINTMRIHDEVCLQKKLFNYFLFLAVNYSAFMDVKSQLVR